MQPITQVSEEAVIASYWPGCNYICSSNINRFAKYDSCYIKDFEIIQSNASFVALYAHGCVLKIRFLINGMKYPVCSVYFMASVLPYFQIKLRTWDIFGRFQRLIPGLWFSIINVRYCWFLSPLLSWSSTSFTHTIKPLLIETFSLCSTDPTDIWNCLAIINHLG